MSADQSNADRAGRIARRNRALEAEGKCTYCPPHKGENSPRDHRWFYGERWPRKAKPKETK